MHLSAESTFSTKQQLKAPSIHSPVRCTAKQRVLKRICTTQAVPQHLQSSSMAPLEALKFDNTVLLELPVDESQQKGVRQVRGAIYSLVDPTPLREPKLVAFSADSLALLGLDAAEVGLQGGQGGSGRHMPSEMCCSLAAFSRRGTSQSRKVRGRHAGLCSQPHCKSRM